jgi:hypothetical protein
VISDLAAPGTLGQIATAAADLEIGLVVANAAIAPRDRFLGHSPRYTTLEARPGGPVRSRGSLRTAAAACSGFRRLLPGLRTRRNRGSR